jgi:hypothetical protein
MVVVSERVWCGVAGYRVSGGGDAACDLSHSLAQALTQGVHSALSKTLRLSSDPRREQRGDSRWRGLNVQSSRSPPEHAVPPSGPIVGAQ